MTATTLFSRVSRISEAIGSITASGLHVQVGTDFVAYRNLRNAQQDRNPVYSMFDPVSSFVDATNAFWITAHDNENNLVHTQAVRKFDLAEQNLDQHLATHRHKYITPGSTMTPDTTAFTSSNALKHITGQVCYHGEFWLGKELRSNQFTQCLSELMFDLILMNWAPDYVFGLVPFGLAQKGIPVRYGYQHCDYGVWHDPEGAVCSEEYLVWMSGTEISNFLERKAKNTTDQDGIYAFQATTNPLPKVAKSIRAL